MKKNITIAILATALVSIILLIIIGLIANAQDEKKSTIDTKVDNSRDTFIQSCLGVNSNYAYCACGYDYLFGMYTEKELKEINSKVTDTHTPKEIMDTHNYCKYLNK